MHATRRGLLIGGATLTPSLAPAAKTSIDPAAPPAIKAHLGVTENPFGPSPAARKAAAEALEETPYYAWALEPLLVKLIAERDGLKPDQVGLCNGSLEALSLLSTAFSKAGPVISAQPSYATPLLYAERQGARLEWVPLAAGQQIGEDLRHVRVSARALHRLRKRLTSLSLQQRLKLPNLDPKRAAIGHGVAPVDRQIEERALKLGGIHGARP